MSRVVDLRVMAPAHETPVSFVNGPDLQGPRVDVDAASPTKWREARVRRYIEPRITQLYGDVSLAATNLTDVQDPYGIIAGFSEWYPLGPHRPADPLWR